MKIKGHEWMKQAIRQKLLEKNLHKTDSVPGLIVTYLIGSKRGS